MLRYGLGNCSMASYYYSGCKCWFASFCDCRFCLRSQTELRLAGI